MFIACGKIRLAVKVLRYKNQFCQQYQELEATMRVVLDIETHLKSSKQGFKHS